MSVRGASIQTLLTKRLRPSFMALCLPITLFLPWNEVKRKTSHVHRTGFWWAVAPPPPIGDLSIRHPIIRSLHSVLEPVKTTRQSSIPYNLILIPINLSSRLVKEPISLQSYNQAATFLGSLLPRRPVLSWLGPLFRYCPSRGVPFIFPFAQATLPRRIV